jgi:hypothetical protein
MYTPGGYIIFMNHSLNKTSISATLHCLTGCAIGEILGMIIGEILGLGIGVTITLAVLLAFLFGYELTTIPLLKHGLSLRSALSLAFAVDTLQSLPWKLSTTL